MGTVFKHRAGWPDKDLGHVEEDGRVYRSDFGIDDRLGRVDLESGKIYSSRLGPDKYIGRVDLQNGRVYRHVPVGADEYVGRVNENGHMDRHDALSPDEYEGRLEEPESLAHTAAAFLLLVLPATDED